MIIVLFHVLYLVGKYVYQKYHVNKQKAIDDALEYKSTPEQITISQHDYKRIDIDSLSYDEDPKPNVRFSPPAYIQRYVAVQSVLSDAKYQGKLRKVVDFGCSELGFLVYLKNTVGLEEILCVDIDRTVLENNLEKAAPLTYEYLHCRMAPLLISVYEGSIADRDKVLDKTDAVICIELIEHLYPDNLTEFPITVFGYIKPKVAIVTTPNAEFNVLFPNFRGFRHEDHKFEWTREQFQSWAENIVLRYPDYSVTFHGICKGPPGTEHLGASTQMAIFHREEEQPAVYPIGVDNLFKLVSSYDYPYRVDNRSDEQKIVDEATYYIHQLSFGRENPREEVPLDRLLQFLTKFSVTLPALRTILEEAGWAVVESESGPVVLVPQQSSHSDISLDDTWTDDEGTHDIDSIYNDSMDNDDDAWNEEPGLPDNVYLLPPMNSENWDAEPSIIIPENRSIIQNTSYLFDGDQDIENIESLNSFELGRDIGLSLRRDIDSSNPDTPRSSTQMTSDDLDGSQHSAATTSVLSTSIIFSNFSDRSRNRVNDLSLTEITNHSSTPVKDSVELTYTPMTSPALNYRAQMSASRASTSPPPFVAFHGAPYDIAESDDSMMNNTFRHCNAVGVLLSEFDRLDDDDYFSESPESKESDAVDPIAKSAKPGSRCQSNDGALPTDEDYVSLISINNCMLDSVPQCTSSPRVVAKRGTGRGVLRAKRRNYFGKGRSFNRLSSTSQSSLQSCSNMATAPVDEPPFVIGTWCPDEANTKHYADLAELNTEYGTSKSDVENPCENTLPLSIQELNKPAHLAFERSANTVQNKSVAVAEQQADGKLVIANKSQTCVTVNADRDVSFIKDSSHNQQSIAVLHAKHINKQEIESESLNTDRRQPDNIKLFVQYSAKETNASVNSALTECAQPINQKGDSSIFEKAQINEHDFQTLSSDLSTQRSSVPEVGGLRVKLPSPESLETSPDSWSPEIADSGYPNSASAQDMTPEYDLSSIAQDQISDSESSSAEEAPRVEIMVNAEVENDDLVNNNGDYEGNNVVPDAGDNEIDDLQPLINDLENDIENENDIFALENEFPLWLLRLLEIPNNVDIQEEENLQNRGQLRQPNAVAVGREAEIARVDEGFDSSSTSNDGNQTDDDYEMQNELSNDEDDFENAREEQDTDDDGDDGDGEDENEMYEVKNMNINNVEDVHGPAEEFSKNGGNNVWAESDT